MPSISHHPNCYLQVGDEKYPVTCELEEQAGSPAVQTKHGWSGTLTFGHDGKDTLTDSPFNESEALLILEDGRQGHILLTSSCLTMGRQSNRGIDFVGQSALSKDISCE